MTKPGISPSHSATAGSWTEHPHHHIDTCSTDTTTFMGRYSLGYDVTHGNDEIWQIDSPPKRYVSLAEHEMYDEAAQLDEEGRYIAVVQPSPPRPHTLIHHSSPRSPLKHTTNSATVGSPRRIASQQAAIAAAGSNHLRNPSKGNMPGVPASEEAPPAALAPRIITDGRIRLHRWYIAFQRTKTAPTFSSDAYDLTHWVQVAGLRYRSEEQEGATGHNPAEVGENWHSSLIAERISRNLVMTKSGKLYELVDTCDEATMRERKGFSDVAIRDFNAGFPARWLTSVVSEARQRGLVQRASMGPWAAKEATAIKAEKVTGEKQDASAKATYPKEAVAGPSRTSEAQSSELERPIRSGKQLPLRKHPPVAEKQLPQRPALSGKQMPKPRTEQSARKRKTESDSDSDYLPEAELETTGRRKNLFECSESEASDGESSQRTSPKKVGRRKAKQSATRKERGRPRGLRRNAFSESESDLESEPEEAERPKKKQKGKASRVALAKKMTAVSEKKQKRVARQSSLSSEVDSPDEGDEATTPRQAAKGSKRLFERDASSGSNSEDNIRNGGSIHRSRQEALKVQSAGTARHSTGVVQSNRANPKKPISRELLSLSKTAFGRLITVENAIMDGLEDIRSSRKTARHSLPAHLSHHGPRTPISHSGPQRTSTPRSSSRKRTSASKWWEVQPVPTPAFKRRKPIVLSSSAPKSSSSAVPGKRRGRKSLVAQDSGDSGQSEDNEEEVQAIKARSVGHQRNKEAVITRVVKEEQSLRRSNESSESDEEGDSESEVQSGDMEDEGAAAEEPSNTVLEQALLQAVWDHDEDEELQGEESDEQDAQSQADDKEEQNEARAVAVAAEEENRSVSPPHGSDSENPPLSPPEAAASPLSGEALDPSRGKGAGVEEDSAPVEATATVLEKSDPKETIRLDAMHARAELDCVLELAEDGVNVNTASPYAQEQPFATSSVDSRDMRQRSASLSASHDLSKSDETDATEEEVVVVVHDNERDSQRTCSPTPSVRQSREFVADAEKASGLSSSPTPSTDKAEEAAMDAEMEDGREPGTSKMIDAVGKMAEMTLETNEERSRSRRPPAEEAEAIVVEIEEDGGRAQSHAPPLPQTEAIATDVTEDAAGAQIPLTRPEQTEADVVDVEETEGLTGSRAPSVEDVAAVAMYVEDKAKRLRSQTPQAEQRPATALDLRARSATPVVELFFESLEHPQSPPPSLEDRQPSPLLDVHEVLHSNDGRLMKVFNVKEDELSADEDDNDSEDSLSEDDDEMSSSASIHEAYYFSD